VEGRTIRELRRIAASEGLRIVEAADTRSQHIRLVLQAPDGRKAVHIAASSPGDNNVGKVVRSWMRRFAKNRLPA
jgi:ABC-type uncharacterized transport system substrate-binding protein